MFNFQLFMHPKFTDDLFSRFTHSLSVASICGMYSSWFITAKTAFHYCTFSFVTAR